MLKNLTFLLFLFFSIHFLFGQTTDTLNKKQNINEKLHQNKNVTVTLGEDNAVLFEDFKENNKKSKLGRLLNKLLYKTDRRIMANAPEHKDYNNFEVGQGKIIRNIEITTLDPFGYSEKDSLKKPSNSFENLGNRLHLKTKKFTIKNFLLFKKGQVFDSIKAKESERLLRTQNYVRRVIITPIATSSPDSVDVVVRELDAWTIYPTGSLSTSSLRARLRDSNFGGLGHDIILEYSSRYKENMNGLYFNYFVNNIQNTFIRANVFFDQTVRGNYIKGIGFDRPFYSQFAKWAGGASLSERFYRDSLPDANMKYSYQPVKYHTQDYWAGYSIPLFKSYKDKPINTNLRMSIRYVKDQYTQTPAQEYDENNFYSDRASYLATIGLSTIDYIQDSFIFNNDRIEDVQVGRVFSITGGIREQFGKFKTYFGAKLSVGNYTRYGYFAGNIEWGSNFKGGKTEQATFRIEGTYFTKVFLLKNWRFRHFLVPELVIGSHRFEHIKDELKLEDAIQGLRAQKITGTKRFSLSYRWQSYAPYEWKGFRFDPFFSYEGAIIGNSTKELVNSKVYSRFSIGLVANNDYLVFSRITISLAYFPSVPDRNYGSFFNANTIDYNIALPRFNHDKPKAVSYY